MIIDIYVYMMYAVRSEGRVVSAHVNEHLTKPTVLVGQPRAMGV